MGASPRRRWLRSLSRHWRAWAASAHCERFRFARRVIRGAGHIQFGAEPRRREWFGEELADFVFVCSEQTPARRSPNRSCTRRAGRDARIASIRRVRERLARDTADACDREIIPLECCCHFRRCRAGKTQGRQKTRALHVVNDVGARIFSRQHGARVVSKCCSGRNHGQQAQFRRQQSSTRK